MANPFILSQPGAYTGEDYYQRLAAIHPSGGTVGPTGFTAPTDVAGGATSSAIASGKLAAAQIPGYLTSMKNIGTTIASETAGEVPEDVKRLLAQEGAESGAVTGAASNAAYLRGLGLTSLGLKETGQKDLESILAATPGYNVSQNPEFQTSSNLAYEEQLQPQVWARQDQQQQFELAQQQAALQVAKESSGGGGWGNPTNAWSGEYFTPAGTNVNLPMSASGY